MKNEGRSTKCVVQNQKEKVYLFTKSELRNVIRTVMERAHERGRRCERAVADSEHVCRQQMRYQEQEGDDALSECDFAFEAAEKVFAIKAAEEGEGDSNG